MVVVVEVVVGAAVDVQAITPVATWWWGRDAVELVQAASITTMATAAIAPILRTVGIYSTSTRGRDVGNQHVGTLLARRSGFLPHHGLGA